MRHLFLLSAALALSCAAARADPPSPGSVYSNPPPAVLPGSVVCKAKEDAQALVNAFKVSQAEYHSAILERGCFLAALVMVPVTDQRVDFGIVSVYGTPAREHIWAFLGLTTQGALWIIYEESMTSQQLDADQYKGGEASKGDPI